MVSGEETPLTATSAIEAYPIISRDGARAAFTVRGTGKLNPVFVTELDRGAPRKLCDACAGAVRSWRFDGSALLIQENANQSILLMDSSTGEHSEYLRGAGSLPSSNRVSWDDRWIAFEQVGAAPRKRSIHIARLDATAPPKQADWIRITDGGYREGRRRWSPDGSTLYFISDRDGFFCIWAQSLDPRTKTPIGKAAPVLHFHEAKRSMDPASGLAVARNKLVFDLVENTGNIWIMSPDDPRTTNK